MAGNIPPPSGRVAAGGIAAVLVLAASLIASWEGVRYSPYQDVVGVWTVCYGHTGADVEPGKKYTKAECDALLREDMAEADAIVRKCIRVPMKPHQEASLVSLTFNVGPRGVCGSTLQRKANAGDWAGACAELDRWNRAGGRVYRGLVLRRADERAMCEGR